MSESPHGVSYPAYRPVVMGSKGMVCSDHPLASQAGTAVLQKGGNAIDAAIAVAAALNVVQPHTSGIGGDGFIMVYDRASDELKVVNCTGAAPYAATRERYLPDGIPRKGILSISVPGLLKGWAEAHQRFGKLKLEEVLEPAIDLADSGFPVSHVVSAAIAGDSLLREFPTTRDVFTRDGRPLRPGEILYQRDLARSLHRIAREGAEVFYQGEVARAIDGFCREQGGLLTLKDLADYRVRLQDPISTDYRGHRVYEAPPNSSGHVLLQELNLVERFDVRSMGCNTAGSVHVMVEAKKLAFADREAYLADPEFVEVPVPGLVSKEYARERAAAIDPERAATNVAPGDPWRYQEPSGRMPRPNSHVGSPTEDTTCLCVVDRWGNAVSQLQSLQSGWGSSVIAGDTGVLLNNRMTYWHLEEDHVDRLEPGKRVRHTMNPIMVFRDASAGDHRELVLVCGTPGADTQVQTNLQVMTHVLDFGMTVAEAVEAPRWRHLQDPTESTYPHTCDDELRLEGRFPPDLRKNLEDRGHSLDIVGDWAGAGSEMMIQVDAEQGGLHGAADPRGDGYAIAW